MALKRALSALIALGVLAAAGAAQAADKPMDPGPRNALSVHPFSITSHGLAIQYER